MLWSEPEVKDMIKKDRLDIEAEPVPLSSLRKGKKKKRPTITKEEFETALKKASRPLKRPPSESDQEKP